MSDFFDELERRSPEKRERSLFKELPIIIEHAKKHSPYYSNILKNVSHEEIDNRSALSKIPVTRKSGLVELQEMSPPFGGLTTVPVSDLARIYQSPGPIFDPQTTDDDSWRAGRALWAASFRPGELVHNTFSYHFTPAGLQMDAAARSIGCTVFPAGVGQTEMQVKTINTLKPTGYLGTPSFLKILIEFSEEHKIDLSCLQKALVGGEALFPDIRKMFVDRGINVKQFYGTADIGLIGYETVPSAGFVIDEHIILEIVTPGTETPVAEGQVGEIVVTNLSKQYPLIRFATGDLSVLEKTPSACGRTNFRIKGWMGRADQTTKVKGMFIRPQQIAMIQKDFPEVEKMRLVIEHDQEKNDLMTLHCESNVPVKLNTEIIVKSIREVTKLRGSAQVCPIGSLPNDGKVIEDKREY